MGPTRIAYFLSIAIALVGTGSAAQASDQLHFTIKRDSTTTSPYKATFKQDIYTTIYRDEPYMVAIPYEETETTTSYDPVTTSQWVCDNPSDSSTCGWKDVTEYQWVSHTQTVTKYRYEEQCCQTNAYTVFDHVWNQEVQVTFPPEVALIAGEKERIGLDLKGDEGTPSVTIDSSDAIFRYKIAAKEMKSGVLLVSLASSPFLTEKSTGAQTIGTATLKFDAKSVLVKFQDKLTNPRVVSNYKISIAEKSGPSLGEVTVATRDGILMSAAIPTALDPEKDYLVNIAVERTGFVMTKPVQFMVQRKVVAEPLDRNKITDRDLVHGFSIAGLGEDAKILFRDDSPNYVTVHSQYTMRVSIVGKTQTTVIAEKLIDRQSLLQDAKKNYTLKIGDLGASAEALKSLVKNTRVRVEIAVVRTSHRIGEVKFARHVDLLVTK